MLARRRREPAGSTGGSQVALKRRLPVVGLVIAMLVVTGVVALVPFLVPLD
jgi:hypothetical protein